MTEPIPEETYQKIREFMKAVGAGTFKTICSAVKEICCPTCELEEKSNIKNDHGTCFACPNTNVAPIYVC